MLAALVLLPCINLLYRLALQRDFVPLLLKYFVLFKLVRSFPLASGCVVTMAVALHLVLML